MKRKARYFIKTKSGHMLCRDGKLRDWIWYGNNPSCLKVYKSERWAIKAARKIMSHQDKHFITTATVMYAYEGEEIGHQGEIIKPTPEGKNITYDVTPIVCNNTLFKQKP